MRSPQQAAAHKPINSGAAPPVCGALRLFPIRLTQASPIRERHQATDTCVWLLSARLPDVVQVVQDATAPSHFAVEVCALVPGVGLTPPSAFRVA